MVLAFSDAKDFRLPAVDERVDIIGRTGTGKTQFGVFVLSTAPFDKMPFIIFDFKNEELFRHIKYIQEIHLGEIPTEPGLYIVRPLPGQEAEVEKFFWNIWAQGNVGIFIDEIYQVDKHSDAFRALLTQGRSKKIPMINLTQRPVECSRFVFSEAEHHVLFDLNHKKDRDIAGEFMPIDKSLRLPEYHCQWYDVKRNKLFHVHKAPGRETILQRFDDRLKPDEADVPQRIFL